MKKDRNYEIDMCNGSLFGKIILFYIPLMLSGILQLLFNAADIIIVGKFAGEVALAAVGSTSSLINLITNVFLGLSVGANVLTARFYGANKEKELSEVVHTAITSSFICGTLLVIIGLLVAKPALTSMGTPEDVLSGAVQYMCIYFLGMPAMMVYNFGAAILRAVGDTKRPLYYLLFAGVVNVFLNLIFVMFFSMGVSGVALATVISQAISAAFIMICLIRSNAVYRIELSKLGIEKNKLIMMMKIGLPAGLQGSIFSISNVLIQSSVNSFGKIAMAGNTAASNLEGFIYVAMNSLQQASICFTSQNYGAGKRDRIHKTLAICLLTVSVVGITLGNLCYYFGEPLLHLYSDNEEAIRYGLVRMKMICTLYFLCGIMDVIVGSIRGLGYSVLPMIVSLTGACMFRIIWIYTVFARVHTLECLYVSYPISWLLTFSVHFICYLCISKKLKRTLPAKN